MSTENPDLPAVQSCTAFLGTRCLGTGTPAAMAETVAAALRAEPNAALLIFDDATGKLMELDAREGVPTAAPAIRRRGRPQMGVVAREVTLLPRHWEWLAAQPGGASVALRRLVEERIRTPLWFQGVRQSQERTYIFLTAIAGHLPHYEEALRQLFRRERAAFEAAMQTWPEDIRLHAQRLSEGAFIANPEKNNKP